MAKAPKQPTGRPARPQPAEPKEALQSRMATEAGEKLRAMDRGAAAMRFNVNKAGEYDPDVALAPEPGAHSKPEDSAGGLEHGDRARGRTSWGAVARPLAKQDNARSIASVSTRRPAR